MNLAEIRRDIILFKDETLKIMREMGKQLFEGIKQKSNELDSKISEIELKLSKFKETNKRMYDLILEQKVYIEKIKNLSEFKSKTETRLLSFDIKLANFFSELVTFKSHYDKILIDNLTVPGIIGLSCKYNTIADYIADNINKTKLYHSEQEKIKNDISSLKKSNENFEKSLNGIVEVSVSTSKLYVDARNNELKNFFGKKIEGINNILISTKNELEENIYKKDDVKSLIKDEIINTKNEILNIIEENSKKNNKENKDKDKDKDNKDKMKNDNKGINSNEIKKELKEIKKNFKDFKTDMETQLMNAIKLIKNQDKNKNNNINNNNININTKSDFLNNNNNNKENDTEEQDNITIKSIYNNNNLQTYYKTLQNNETRYYNNNNNKIKKEENNESSNNIDKNISFRINAKSKQYKITNPEKTPNIKPEKETNKLKGVLLNPIYLDTEKNEHNIIKPETPKIKRRNNTIREIPKYPRHPRISTKYKTFSENKNNITKRFLFENNNNIKIEDNKKQNKIYLNTEKTKTEKKRYVIHSINSDNLKNIKSPNKNDITDKENDNTFSKDEQSNFRKNIKTENNEDNNNIAIRLIKNKKQAIDEFNLDYIKQYYPTLNLYKNYFNKKMVEKEKEKLIEKIKVPKKISPAFGRTAYTELVKPNNNINLKNYNAKVNIIIDNNNMKNIIQERKYFYTLNNENIKRRSYTKDKNKKKQKKEEFNIKNISV